MKVSVWNEKCIVHYRVCYEVRNSTSAGFSTEVCELYVDDKYYPTTDTDSIMGECGCILTVIIVNPFPHTANLQQTTLKTSKQQYEKSL